MVGASSNRIFDPLYSGTAKVPESCRYRALTLFGWPSQAIRVDSNNPILRPEPQLTLVWAVPLSLAATDGIDKIFLFL
jgi:hypothetical protein